MPDLVPPKKLLFWTFWTLVIALVMIPSVVLVDMAQQYWRFISAWQPGTLRNVTFRGVPHHGIPTDRVDVPEVRFVEFRVKAPKAKKVFLGGDFNGWKPETLPLFRKSKKEWEVLVPLPPGKYEFAFQADGNWIDDPKCAAPDRHGDIKTCMKQVQ